MDKTWTDNKATVKDVIDFLKQFNDDDTIEFWTTWNGIQIDVNGKKALEILE